MVKKCHSSENGQVQGLWLKMSEITDNVQRKSLKDIQKSWRTIAQDFKITRKSVFFFFGFFLEASGMTGDSTLSYQTVCVFCLNSYSAVNWFIRCPKMYTVTSSFYVSHREKRSELRKIKNAATEWGHLGFFISTWDLPAKLKLNYWNNGFSSSYWLSRLSVCWWI